MDLILQGLEVIEGSISSHHNLPPFALSFIDVHNWPPHIHLHHHPLSFSKLCSQLHFILGELILHLNACNILFHRLNYQFCCCESPCIFLYPTTKNCCPSQNNKKYIVHWFNVGTWCIHYTKVLKIDDKGQHEVVFFHGVKF
jgi:hypothetical protein